MEQRYPRNSQGWGPAAIARERTHEYSHPLEREGASQPACCWVSLECSRLPVPRGSLGVVAQADRGKGQPQPRCLRCRRRRRRSAGNPWPRGWCWARCSPASCCCSTPTPSPRCTPAWPPREPEPPTAPPPAGSASNGSGGCRPRRDIVFMKTHKTASSTLLNILFRFGQKHGLRFAFPNGRNDFDYPAFFARSLVQDYRPGACFNIICNHMRFHYDEVRGLVPPNATFITVLRDPARLFESSFHYFGPVVPLTWKLSGGDKLAEFLRDPERYYDPGGYNAHYLRNLLFFDLGYDSSLDPRSPQVQEHILEVERRFHLVLLQEYFDESLVLLKELLCWELEDVLYFKLNARRDSPVPRLSGELYRRATAWNMLDARLYRHFNASFWRKVEAFGRERMAREVAALRCANERMRRICIDGGQPVDAAAIQDEAMQPWQPLGAKSILGYNLKKSIGPRHAQLCRRMLTPEIQYLMDLGVNLWVTKLWKLIRDFLRW
ncbi:galactosylceramide sulfotransferase isoform X1 [Oryctolagus cuniculus]|uniref:galactosylceramide sulfotransferase isoform X1 n=1 Tax=Oryctolagus cuniculus TaxID=9986 RepID=UPI0038798193